MDATTMRSTSSLIHKLKSDFPNISFVRAEHFSWSPAKKVVSYNPKLSQVNEQLLHELSHGLLGHQAYRRDVELVALEAAAWDKAAELADEYHVAFREATAEENLDTYRDWLHARSTCPDCTATGYQTNATTYQCVACTQQWTVNEARLCGLRRKVIPATK